MIAGARAGLIALALGGCSVLAPDVGKPLVGECKDVDSDPAHAVSFAADIRPIFGKMPGGCSCHMPTGTGPGAATALVGLDLSTFATVRAGGLNSAGKTAIPGKPCTSVIYLKVSEAPPFGSRMPLNGPPYLDDESETLLHDWIAEGAQDN